MKTHTMYYTQNIRENVGVTYEVNKKPSLTQPDQTLTIQQIMDRYAHGLNLGGVKEPIYDYDEENPDEELPDLVGQRIDQVETYQQIKEEKEELDEKIKKYPKKTVPPLKGAEGVEQKKDEKASL